MVENMIIYIFIGPNLLKQIKLVHRIHNPCADHFRNNGFKCSYRILELFYYWIICGRTCIRNVVAEWAYVHQASSPVTKTKHQTETVPCSSPLCSSRFPTGSPCTSLSTSCATVAWYSLVTETLFLFDSTLWDAGCCKIAILINYTFIFWGCILHVSSISTCILIWNSTISISL